MVSPSNSNKKQLEFTEGWRLLKKLDGNRAIYEKCSYDKDHNLVRSNFRRIYDGQNLEAEYTVNEKEQRNGEYIQHTKKGKIVCYYEADILHGSYMEYIDGVLRVSGPYEHGRRMGSWVFFDKNSNPIRQIIYGIEGIISDTNDEIAQQTEEKKSRPIGFGPYDEKSAPKKSKEVITLPSISTEEPDPGVKDDPETRVRPVIRGRHKGKKKQTDKSNVHS
ncbi:MAG: hypothetical protein ILP11_01280 [Alphaproteobacteria bacterium]|nr:hypothetical protein [Alphaproteobacteria bacterium]